MDKNNIFTVNKNEKFFVEDVWGYIDESILNKPALKLRSSNETLTFAHIAMLNVNISLAVYQSFLKLSPNLNRGWISDFFVDFYMQQLAESEDVSQTCAALLCSETNAILRGVVTAATYRSVQRKCISSDQWCNIILCPVLRNSHFMLFVIGKIKQSICCYDSLSPLSNTFLRQIAKSFGKFFYSGKKSKYWNVLPPFIRSDEHCIVIKDKSFITQDDTDSCGLYCCAIAEEVALAKRNVRQNDQSETLRMYITLSAIRRSHLLDIGLSQLFKQSNI